MTTLFLKKFYTAFQEELSALKGITGEKEKEPSNSGIGDLKQKMSAIEKLCQDIIENEAKTKQSIQQLSDKIDEISEELKIDHDEKN
jgi:chromosome segregation ATPase